jgi:murein tripeptide amidase MpaA
MRQYHPSSPTVPSPRRRAPVSLALLLLAVFLPPGATGQEATSPRTHAEATGWTELTPHHDVVAFYERLTALSRDVRLREIGQSAEGLPLLAVTLARPAVTDPWEAHGSGRPIVLIGAQVHGDEPAGKEGLMLFARDLAVGPLNHLLDHAVFVLVPQINPDGAEAGAWGTRASRRGRNLNRDYLRLDNPETGAFVEKVVAAWRPHVIVDAHELPGPPRIYDFYTSFPRDIRGPTLAFELTRSAVVPAIVAALEDEGYSHFPYHRVPSGLVDDPSIGVSAGTYGARALSSYGGAQAAIAILFESLRERDARIGIEDRARRHHVAMTALAEYVAENGERVVRTVAEERRTLAMRGAAWDEGDSIAVRIRQVASREESYRLQWQGEIVELSVPILDSAIVELGRVRPVGYLIEPDREEVARHLARHGLEVERLEVPVRLSAETFRVDSVRRAASPYEGYVERTWWTTPREGRIDVPAGAFLVRTDQANARIVFHLLEPEDENSLASVGWFATRERPGAVLPVHRLRELPPSPTEVVTRTDARGAPRWIEGTVETPPAGADAFPGTRAEAAGWSELTPYDDVVAFYRTLAASSPHVRMTEVGRSREGRPLHLLVLSAAGVRAPWEAHATGKPILFIGAQVHGDEPAGKEGLMLFARDLVHGHLRPLLDQMVFLLVPQINPDGAEAGTWGTRANASGYNLNRDYLRLDNPESRAVVEEVLVPWRPHVVVDAHELGGPPRVYDFYTWHPTNPHGPRAPAGLAGRVLIPAIVEALESGGYSHIIYHTPGGLAQNPEGGIFVPVYGRTLNDYAGSQGMSTILFESLREGDARVNIGDRAERHRIAMEALALEMATRTDEVVGAFHEGRTEMYERGSRWDEGDRIAVLREPAASRTVDYRVAVREEVDIGQGTEMRWTGETRTVRTPLYDSATVTLARIRPEGYVIEAQRGDLVQKLLTHGLRVERILEEADWAVESFRIESLDLSGSVYEGYVPQRFETTPEPGILTVPAGAYLVRGDQPGAALVFHLLEPEDENSFAITGAFLTEARPGRVLPVHRVREIPSVPLRTLDTGGSR